MANVGATTWFDVAQYVGSLLNRGEDFATPIATSELRPAPLATRPARSDLDTEKFSSAWSTLPDWRDAVDASRRRPRAPRGPDVSDVENDVVAVVVDYHADQFLIECVDSLFDNGVTQVVVVENGEVGSVPRGAARPRRRARLARRQPWLRTRRESRCGRGARPPPYVLVSNPDVVVHDGAIEALVDYLDHHRDVALVGPRSFGPTARSIPRCACSRTSGSPVCTRFSRRCGPTTPPRGATAHARTDGSVDWVSGACFLVRRRPFEEVGGFDERYFMFAEDMALCWALREHGFRVAATPDAVVTHIEGVSRARASREMVIAHHRSALRFEFQTARGWRRLLVPFASVVLEPAPRASCS